MPQGSSEKVREVADREYVAPAKGKQEISFSVGELQTALRSEHFPGAHINQICTSVESDKFWKPRGLQMLSPRRQPRRVDTVFRFAFVGAGADSIESGVRADPLLELSGLLRGAIREGAAAFVRELRKDEAKRHEVDSRKSA